MDEEPSSSDSSCSPVARRSKRKKTLSTSSSSSSSINRQMLRRRRKRRRQLQEIVDSNSSDSNSEGDTDNMVNIAPDSDESGNSGSVGSSVALRMQTRRSLNSVTVTGESINLRPFVIRIERARPSISRQLADTESSEIVDRHAPTHARTVASTRAQPGVTAVTAATTAVTSGNTSDSGDEGGEKCAICLRSIRSQEIGSPEGCDHTFCLACLITWSKSCNQCPLDRQPFKLILVRENLQGAVIRQMAVEERTLPVVFDEEDLSFCLICGEFNREEQMLLCDGCNRGFHIDCLTPPLDAVPEVEEWFCPTCQAWDEVTAEMRARRINSYEGVRSSTVSRPRRRGLRSDNMGSSFPNTSRSSRVVEWVSYRVAQQISYARRQGHSPSTEPVLEQAVDGPSTSGTQPLRRSRKSTVKKKAKKKPRKKNGRTVRRRYVTKKKKIIVEEDGTITEKIYYRQRKVKKRGTKRRSIRPTRAASTAPNSGSAHDRLSRTLGIAPPSTEGLLLPEVSARRRPTPAVASNLGRYSGGLHTLNIFEPRNELAPVSSGSDEEIGGGSMGLLSRARSARPRPLERRKAVELFHSAPTRQRPPPQACDGPTDLLSSILESQTIWHSKKSDVIINNDGKVEPLSTNRVDVRNAGPERVVSTAPIFPSSGTRSFRSSGVRPAPSATQSRPDAPATVASGSGLGAPFNDREGYTNFLNNMTSRPSPLCRGGPPLRFRMPVRPQLRRIPLLSRRPSRPLYDDEEDDNAAGDGGCNEEENGAPMITSDSEVQGRQSEQELDLYSDIEPNAERDNSECETTDYPTLGPPPEPPAFLLNMAMDGEEKSEDIYDPAEPCDSDEELVIDETVPAVKPLPPPPSPPDLIVDAVISNENDVGDDCPVLSLYSSDTLSFSRQGEEDRARELAEKKDTSLTEEASQSVLNDEHTRSPESDSGVNQLSDPISCQEGESPEKDASPKESRSRSASSSPDRTNSVESAGNSPAPNRNRKESKHLPNSRSSSVNRTSRNRRSSDTDDISDEDGKSPRLSRSRLSSFECTNQDSKENEQSANGEHPRVSTGLEGLDIEEVSSELEEHDFNDVFSLSSLSLSGISDQSRFSSPTRKKKKKKRRTKIKGRTKKTANEEGEIVSDKVRSKYSDKRDGKTSDENKSDDEGAKERLPKAHSPDRKVLSSQENKKKNSEEKETWKKLSKKGRNYREGRKSSRERGLSKEKRKGGSLSPKRDRKKLKDKKKTSKKKELVRYDVRKIVKEKETQRKDEFGRDLPTRSKSTSQSKSRSRSRGRVRPIVRKPSRSPVRRNSRSPRRLSRSPVRRTSRSPRRLSRSPVRRTSRSPRRLSRSPVRRISRSPVRRARRKRTLSRSPLSVRRGKRGRRSSERDEKKISRSRGRRSRSASRSPRRDRFKSLRARKSLSRSVSLSPAHRGRDGFSPVRVRRSVSLISAQRSYAVHAWSPSKNLAREQSLENLTVVLTSKDKKKKKKRKDERKERNIVEGRRKKGGNSKEVFASGDNVLVSVNFSKSNKSDVIVIPPDIPVRDVSKKKKRKTVNDDSVRAIKKNKANSAVETALASVALQKRKKLARLTEEDAEVILNRKPVAVIDLDMSPYREQTPSPINVVIVSDSGSGDEGKAPVPQQQHPRPRSPEITLLPSPAVVHLMPITGPKTPPEPSVKFSISKPVQIRQIANPLADVDEGPEESSSQVEIQVEQNTEIVHKGPNTPPEPRGPSTPPRGPTTPPMVGPNTPRSQSPQSSPDAYDPFEPTKSRSVSPVELPLDVALEKPSLTESINPNGAVGGLPVDDAPKHTEPVDAIIQEPQIANNTNDTIPTKDISSIEVVEIVSTPSNNFSKAAAIKRSTPQPIAPNTISILPVFSLPSPKTSNRTGSMAAAVSGLQRIQHRLGSPVSKTPNSVKSTPEKRNCDPLPQQRVKRNGPVPDGGSNETVDMDDSPYSPGSSEGDDLFDPPPAASAPLAPSAHKPAKSKPATPVKAPNKFDLLFGSLGPNISPLRNGAKKPAKMLKSSMPKPSADKKVSKSAASTAKKSGHKMDEDQLRILDEVPSSAVELQVKDKYLKKLNRQERVVDEVKTVLKPHYAKKHISKEEYKQILRRAVPKVCHSRGGEINPSKIQQLVEAYVRKYRQHKKKSSGVNQKQSKLAKTTMFS